MARDPTMTTADGRWSVEVVTGRNGSQHFRVKRLDRVMAPGSGWTSTGRMCTTIDEVRELLGAEAFATLTEQRAQRFEGGR